MSDTSRAFANGILVSVVVLAVTMLLSVRSCHGDEPADRTIPARWKVPA